MGWVFTINVLGGCCGCRMGSVMLGIDMAVGFEVAEGGRGRSKMLYFAC